jgi:hypothetical protein
MRTVSRLRLLCFASSARFPQPYGFHITVLSTNLLVALSNLGQAHHKHTLIWKYGFGDRITWDLNPHTLMVDLGGFAPPSRTLFSLLHTAITYSIYLSTRLVNYIYHQILNNLTNRK